MPESSAPEVPAPVARREPTEAERAELERLHSDVLAASEACERSPFGTLGRKRLRTAERAEAEALERFGFQSHLDFITSTRAEVPAVQTATGDELWATPSPVPRAGSFAALADVNTRTEPVPAPEPVTAPDAEPAPEIASEAVPMDGAAELAHVQDALLQVRTELSAAQNAKQASEAELAAVRAQLDGHAAVTQEAQAGAEAARRHLRDAEVELERLRTELTELTTARFTDEDALTKIRSESEQELERMRTLAAAEVGELAARLTAFEDETARAAEQVERAHRDELTAARAELASAREVAQRSGAEINDAVRSRDVAIDELARQRAEIDSLRGELGAVRAEAGRWQEERDALLARATEAEAALGSARADSDLDVSRRDAATKQHEAQIAELETQLSQASIAAKKLALARGDLDLVRNELQAAREQLASAQEVTDQLHAELAAVHAELAAARAENGEVRAARDVAQSELATTALQLTSLQATIEDLESQVPTVDGPTEDLRRLVEVAQRLASGTASDQGPPPKTRRAKDDVGQELADLEARVAKLRAKRRRMKSRLEAGRTELRDVREAVARAVHDGDAERARIRQETEVLAARVALETASALEEAVRDRRAAQVARHAAIEHAGAELAALEAGVETVAIDAGALRSKLAAIRTQLLRGSDPDATDAEEPATDER